MINDMRESQQSFPAVCMCRETNLKVRQALVETAEMSEDIEQLSAFDGSERFADIIAILYLVFYRGFYS